MSIDRHERALLSRAQDQAEKAAENIRETLEAGELGSGVDFAGDQLLDAQSDLNQVLQEAGEPKP